LGSPASKSIEVDILKNSTTKNQKTEKSVRKEIDAEI